MATTTKKVIVKDASAPKLTVDCLKKARWNGQPIPVWTSHKLALEGVKLGKAKGQFKAVAALMFFKVGQKGCAALKSILYKEAVKVDGGKGGNAYKSMTAQVSIIYKLIGLKSENKARGKPGKGITVTLKKIRDASTTLLLGAKAADFDHEEMTGFMSYLTCIQKHFTPTKTKSGTTTKTKTGLIHKMD